MNQDMTEIAERAFALMEQQKEIERQVKELKDQLKEAGNAQYGPFAVEVKECERETFKLSDFKKVVAPSLWAKVQGFVTLTQYKQVRIIRL